MSTTPKAMRETFGAMPRSRIALETGHEAIVAHARNVRLIGESRRKDDRLDAMTLARLARARIDPQLLRPVKHRSAEAQADLTVIRARAALVRARTMLVNAARGLTKDYGERLRGCNARGMKPKATQDLSPELKGALEPLMKEIESVSERIREYECSRRPVPLHPLILDALLKCKRQSPYQGDGDFLFPSIRLSGKKPLSPDSLLKKSIRPALERAEIKGKIVGWHTFRYTLGTFLRELGTDIKTAQDLLRHASSRLTLDLYTHAVSCQKRDANSKVVELLLPGLVKPQHLRLCEKKRSGCGSGSISEGCWWT